MTGTPKRLCQVALTNTSVEIYKAVSDGKTIIMDLMAANTTANQRMIHIFIGSPDDDNNCLIHHAKIAANDYLHIGQIYQVLNKGESLYAHADTGGVTMIISGLERV